MYRIPTALVGVNLTENENIFIGAIVKVNDINGALLIVEQSDLFTDKLNGIIGAIEKLFNASKNISQFVKEVKFINTIGARLMFYDKTVIISNPKATGAMITDEVKKLHMNAFAKLKVIEKTPNPTVATVGAQPETVVKPGAHVEKPKEVGQENKATVASKPEPHLSTKPVVKEEVKVEEVKVKEEEPKVEVKETKPEPHLSSAPKQEKE